MSTQNFKSIWVPETRADAWDMALMLSNNNQRDALDLVKCHASFGHHWGYDMGQVMVNTTSIKGKPTMRADAIAGIAYNSGLVDRIQIVHHDAEACVIECVRSDDASKTVHKQVFTMQQAHQMGLTNNSNWKRMPLQMLRARCITAACRSVWPDAVSGIYSSDEIADNMPLSDQERFEITTRSLGEDDVRYAPSAVPQPMPEPQPSNPPQPKPVEPKQTADRHMITVDTVDDFYAVCESYNLPEAEVKRLLRAKKIKLDKLTGDQMLDFFYSHVMHSATRLMPEMVDAWYESKDVEKAHSVFKSQYKALSMFDPAFYGPRLKVPAFVETLRTVCTFTNDEVMVRGVEVLRQMSPDDWSAYDYVNSLSAEQSA
jgi:hypothetical protein